MVSAIQESLYNIRGAFYSPSDLWNSTLQNGKIGFENYTKISSCQLIKGYDRTRHDTKNDDKNHNYCSMAFIQDFITRVVLSFFISENKWLKEDTTVNKTYVKVSRLLNISYNIWTRNQTIEWVSIFF